MKNNSAQCSICKKVFEYGEMYEYRGTISCDKCFDKLISKRDYEREQIIIEENHKTNRFKGLNISNDTIGKINKKIMKSDIEIAKKESDRIKNYERKLKL